MVAVRRILAAVLFAAIVWCLSHVFGHGVPRAVHKSYETSPDDDLVVARTRFVKANSKLQPLGRVGFAGGPHARPGHRVGGARLRRPGVVSLNEDDAGAGGPDNGAGLSSDLGADGDVARAQAAYTKISRRLHADAATAGHGARHRRRPHNAPFSLVYSHAGDGRAPGHLRGHASIILEQLGKKGLDAEFVHAVQTQHIKQEHFYQLPAGSSPIHTYDVLDGTDATDTQNDQEDAEENADADADASADAMSQTSDHAAIPLDFAAWHGSVGAGGSHTPWTNEDLNNAAIAQLPEVSEFLDIIFDEDITRLRGLWQASFKNGHRTQAVFGINSLENIMEFVWWLAQINHPIGKRAWDLMCAIIHAIEETNLTTMGRTSILSNVLMEVLVANARGTLGNSQTDSEKLARAICRLLQVAQCRYAAVAAEALASGERPDLAAFWRAMHDGASGRGVANALRPMYQEDNQLTKQNFFLVPEHGNPDVVREAIFHLYNSGVRMGDTRLADLLLNLPSGPGNWVPGPTFEAEPELRV